VWFAAGVVAVLVFAIFVAETTWSLLTPGYVLVDGELAADFAVLFGSLSLASLCVFRARRLSRRADTLFEHADTEQWLPPREPRDGQGEIDLDAQVFRLRTLSPRAWGVAVLWCAVLVGGMVGLSAITSSADSLLATGTRTTGEVLTVLDSRKPSMWVRYTAGGMSQTAEIVRSSGRHYKPGESVTVVYNPTDPEDARTTEETNYNQYLVGFCVVPMLLALLFLPLSVVAAARWRRRYHAVRRTGWRAASVTVLPDYPVRKGRHAPDIQVRYRDGSTIWLRASSSTHGATVLKDEPNQPAWVGGTGRDMVVLFPQARWRKLPYAVPAFAKDQRRPCRARQRSTYRAAAAPPRPVGKRSRGRRQPPP
jgi:hypothetical protein